MKGKKEEREGGWVGGGGGGGGGVFFLRVGVAWYMREKKEGKGRKRVARGMNAF